MIIYVYIAKLTMLGKETKRGKILKVLLFYIASPLVIYIASAPPP